MWPNKKNNVVFPWSQDKKSSAGPGKIKSKWIDYYNAKTSKSGTNEEFQDLKLTDLKTLTTLGEGSFGRVDLVQIEGDPTRSFALKLMKRARIVGPKQQQHVMSEKEIMGEANSPFIVKLFKTFKDEKYFYLLMEGCLGGDLWTALDEKEKFDEASARFYTGCVVEAFDYLHARNIAHRDVKPENLLLDNQGYLKLADFGFAKKLNTASQTTTFCGTSAYMAPEVFLKTGHDTRADYWSLGVVIFEMLTGVLPFKCSNDAKMYEIILKGIGVVEFPQNITWKATKLIKQLCKEDPAERLGYHNGSNNEIRKHTWFDGFNWEGLKLRTLIPPILPQIKNVTDTSNFRECPADARDPPPDDVAGWDAEF